MKKPGSGRPQPIWYKVNNLLFDQADLKFMFKWLSSVNIKLGNNGQSGNLKITPTHKKNSFERIKAGALIWLNDPEYPTTVSRYDMGAANRNALNHSQTFDQSGLVEDDTACHTLVGNVYFEPVQEAIDLYILQVRY